MHRPERELDANSRDFPDRKSFNSDEMRDLYNHFPARGDGDKSRSGNDPKFIDLSSDPYAAAGHQSDFPEWSQFAKEHPRRAEVLRKDHELIEDIRDAKGHLHGNFSDLMDGARSIRREEERFARLHGGHITRAEKRHLLHEENELREDLRDSLSGGDGHQGHHHRGHGHHGSHDGNPPPGSGDDSGSGNGDGSGTGSDGGDGSTPPPGSDGGDGSTPPPGSDGGTDPTGSDSQGAIFGAWVQPSSVGAKGESEAVQTFENQIGRKLGLNNFYAAMGTMPDLSVMQNDVKKGTIPMLSLHGLPSDDVVSGKDDAYLRKVADELKQVPGDVWVRYGWEMDGTHNQNWVKSPEEYKAAWQHVHDIFAQEGVTNAKWVWCPTSQAFNGDHGGAAQYYPGSDYVDFVSSDGYSGIHGGKYRTPQEIFQTSVDFAASVGKPFVIGETGAADSLGPAQDAQFVQQMQEWIKENPRVKAVAWFSARDNVVSSSPEELAAFREFAADPYFS